MSAHEQSSVEFLLAKVAGLEGVLEARRELDQAQAARIQVLEVELGETHAKLRAALMENQRLTTMLNGYARPENFARNSAAVSPGGAAA